MTLRALIFGDIHLKTSRDTPPYARPDVNPDHFDVVISIGDVVDDNVDHASDIASGRAYEERGRAFFEYADSEFDCPILAVPGNHDPLNCTKRLAADLDGVTVLHKEAVSATDVATGGAFDGFSFVGWGCEQFDLTPAFDYLSYEATDPRRQPETRGIEYWADACARRVQAVLARFLIDDIEADNAAAELGINDHDCSRFVEVLVAFESEYRRIREALNTCVGKPVLLSHETPFGVSFDHPRKSSTLNSSLHCGSLPLKLAIVDTEIHTTFCGHFHTEGMDVIDIGNGHTFIANLGSPGVAAVEIEDDAPPRIEDLVEGE